MTPSRSVGSAIGLGLTVLTALAVASGEASAQLTVYDPAVTARNAVTAIVKESVLRTQQEQHSQLRRMAQRLSMFTDLAKYSLPDAPRWRIHDFENPQLLALSRGLHAALNYGDAAGAAVRSLARSARNASARPAVARSAAGAPDAAVFAEIRARKDRF